MTDAFGQGAAALAGDFDEPGIAGDLVKERDGWRDLYRACRDVAE